MYTNPSPFVAFHVFRQELSGRGVQVNTMPYHKVETAKAAKVFFETQDKAARAHFKSEYTRCPAAHYLVGVREDGTSAALTYHQMAELV